MYRKFNFKGSVIQYSIYENKIVCIIFIRAGNIATYCAKDIAPGERFFCTMRCNIWSVSRDNLVRRDTSGTSDGVENAAILRYITARVMMLRAAAAVAATP